MSFSMCHRFNSRWKTVLAYGHKARQFFQVCHVSVFERLTSLDFTCQ